MQYSSYAVYVATAPSLAQHNNKKVLSCLCWLSFFYYKNIKLFTIFLVKYESFDSGEVLGNSRVSIQGNYNNSLNVSKVCI